MEAKREEVAEFLTAIADALAGIYEHLTIYVAGPRCDLGGKVGLIELDYWTPTCVEGNDELVEEVSQLDELGEYAEATTLLWEEYDRLAWEDAQKLAAALGGDLLTVHWVELEGLSGQQSATLILLDRL